MRSPFSWPSAASRPPRTPISPERSSYGKENSRPGCSGGVYRTRARAFEAGMRMRGTATRVRRSPAFRRACATGRREHGASEAPARARHDRRAAPPHCGRHTRYGHLRGAHPPRENRRGRRSRRRRPYRGSGRGSRRARSFRHAARDREEKCLRPAAGELPRESTVFRHRGRRPHDVYPGALHRRSPRGCDPARHGRWDASSP